MVDYILYGTLLRSFTLPVSNFQKLAVYIPSGIACESEITPLDDLLRYASYLNDKKHASRFAFKQYYSLNWFSEIRSPLTMNEKLEFEKFLSQFLKNVQNFNKQVWDISILSTRIQNMLLASHYIFHQGDASPMAKEYFKTILQQAIYLRRKLRKHKRQREYILYIIRATYMSISFLEERSHLKYLMTQLQTLLDDGFYADGGHISRNASFHLKIVDELIKLKDLARSAGIALPNKLQTVIVSSVDYLSFMRHPDGKLAVFNGSYESDPDYIDSILSVCGTQKKTGKFIKLKDTGFYRLNAPNMTLITDLQDFESRHQYDYQSMLSFELSIGKQRVFSNCGSGDEMGKEWIDALQKSAAHNMPVINIPDIRPSLKRPIIVGKKNLRPFVATNAQGTTLESAQSYEFGKTGHITHHRHLTLFKTGKVLRGEDTFNLVENDKKIPVEEPECFIRFHLGKDIQARSSGTSVVLTVPDQGDWMFTIGSGKIVLEPSIYLGQGSPQETTQIVIKLKLSKPQIKFRWTLQELSKSKHKTKQKTLQEEAQQEIA